MSAPAGSSTGADDLVATSELAALRTQQAALQAELAALRERVDHLYKELGVGGG